MGAHYTRVNTGTIGMGLQICFSLFASHYISSREDSALLREIREPDWSWVIELCSSFAARDCNACFSQIFEKRTFG